MCICFVLGTLFKAGFVLPESDINSHALIDVVAFALIGANFFIEVF